MSYDMEVHKILKDWKRDAGTTRVIQYTFHKGVLTVYTSQPGYLIGKEGTLINKYAEKFKKEVTNFKKVKLVETAYYWV